MKKNNAAKDVREQVYSYLLLGIGLLFYLFFAIYDGTVICADSPSYIAMSVTREAFYPSLLAFSRSIFGNGDTYLFAIIVLQSVIAAFSAWSLEEFLRKEVPMPKWISLLLMLLPLMVSFLCRFAALRSSMYSNSIMTEGIAISLYLVVIREVLEYLYYQTKKSLLIGSMLCALLISTRKQMLVTLALLALAIIVVAWCKKNLLKGMVKAVIISILVMVAVMLYDRGYNYVVRGEVAGHSSDNRFVMTMIFYTADEKDVDYIEDTQMKELFLDIYKVCNDSGFLGNSAGSGWYQNVTHFGDHYDHIQIDTMWPMIHEYVEKQKGLEPNDKQSMELEMETDRIMNVLISDLLPHKVIRITKVLWNNFLSGLVTTVAQRKPILVWYSIFAYFGYSGLLIYNIKENGMNKVNKFALLTVISIVLNVGLVSAVIFCQTRYTIYNMPLFYMSGLLLLYEVYQTKFGNQSIRSE